MDLKLIELFTEIKSLFLECILTWSSNTEIAFQLPELKTLIMHTVKSLEIIYSGFAPNIQDVTIINLNGTLDFDQVINCIYHCSTFESL